MTTLRSSDTKDRPQAVFPSAGLFLGPGQAGDLHRENVKVPTHIGAYVGVTGSC